MNSDSPRRGGFRISEWAIRNPVPVAVLFIGAVLAGLISYSALPIKNFPNINFPAVLIQVTRSGAAPAEMETQVTRPVENALAGIPNIESIGSNVTQGTSVTIIQFKLGEDTQKVYDDVKAKIDQIRNTLPKEIDPPIVQRLEADDAPIVTYTVSSPSMSEQEVSWFIDNTVSRDLQAQEGVSQIQRLGGLDREVNVLIDPDRLAAQGLTASQVNDALAAADVDAPGGRVTIGGREQILRVLGAAVTVDRIRNLSIPASGGRFVRLSDVADVGDGAAEPRAFALLDGRPVVAFSVLKTKLASEVSTEDGVDAEIVRLGKQYPNVTFRKVNSQVDQTRAAFSATAHTLLEGMALAALVVWLFLRDWRATAITAIAMPVSLIPTFALMNMFGFSLNVVTLLGLTLVIGILVDDAIVEVENIEKRVYVGLRPFRAAIEGADQIGLAVVATTFSIVAVFLPVAFMPGIPGQFFREFGITVSVAVLFSLVVARLLTPLMAAYLLTPKVAKIRRPMPRYYTRILTWVIDHRIYAVAIGFVVFVCSMALFLPLKKGVQPESNPNYYYINIQAPPGATLADMRRTVAQVDALLARQPETQDVFAQVGGGGISGGFGTITNSSGVNNGTVLAILKPDRKVKVAQIRDRLRPLLRQIPDVRTSFDISGFGSGGVQVILTSETGVGLEEAALELQREMRTVPGIADPRPSTPPSGPELIVRPKVEEAARLGVSVTAIADAARVATIGDIDANVSKLDEGERRIPVRVRFPEADRTNLSIIRNLRLPTASGGTTTLDSVAQLAFQAGPAEIDRFDRKRNMIIMADTTGDTQVGDAINHVHKLPILQHLPPGVALASQGQEKAYAELFGGFAVAIVSAIGLVYAVMVLLFRSFFKPVIILSALPTAIGGALLLLLATNLSLSIPSLIGFLMLMGLAAKNSILLVEYAIEREREGHSQREALMEACRERARPIIMTTMAMAAGMLPTALSLGKGSEFRQPMAVAVIGGLITSTVLSLVLVPAVYALVDDIERWLAPWFARLVTPREAPGGPVPVPRPSKPVAAE
ncbi:MAG TPA: efflux RND transporter permease subunit [Caulobacteraceae bacterium]|jgi:HAE1 family hydrophobic/amphiphilic exporter-1|nr:efflux RND transporter permease subunit [Caulobacteraceae bacterium]